MNKGFTLIELICVITILGLISELLLSTSEFYKDIVSIFLAIEFAFTAIEFSESNIANSFFISDIVFFE